LDEREEPKEKDPRKGASRRSQKEGPAREEGKDAMNGTKKVQGKDIPKGKNEGDRKKKESFPGKKIVGVFGRGGRRGAKG